MKPLPKATTAITTTSDGKIGRGVDLALVTLAFLGIGYGIDRWLGTKPVFMIVFAVLAIVGEFIRFWYDYDARMKVLEAQRASARLGDRS